MGVLALAVMAPATAHATPTRYSLAGGCYALRSASTGKYVARQTDGRYAATASVVGSAEPFRMKATALGRYLLYGTKRDLLAKGPSGISGVRTPSAAANWRVDPAGPTRFSVSRPGKRGKAIASSSRGGLKLAARSASGMADDFTFDRAAACARFPEADSAARGPAFKGATAQGEVKGTLDAHAHLTAFEFLGGNFHCGRPWSPYGVEAALPDCASIQGPRGSAAPVQNFLDYGEPVHPHDTVGWPTFNDWPSPHGLSYEGTYWKWIERSWQSGVRMMVTQLVENSALCEKLQSKRNSCDEMDSARLQRNDLYALQNYIDAQYGGPGKGFLRVVTDPLQARKVINQGKLAVVMGMETSSLFGCKIVNDVSKCDQAKIDSGLKEFQDLGVRSFFPVHKFDNALGGTKMDGGALGLVINGANKQETGKFWNVKTCTGPEADNTQLSPSDGNGGLGSILGGSPLAAAVPGQTPSYPPPPHCNQQGLTPLGESLLQRMMKQHLIVEIDHMDARSRNQALSLLEARKYSGVISAHSWASPLNYPRIYKLGGLVTPSAGDATGFAREWAAYRKLRDPRFYFGFGYGSDMNGLAVQGAANPARPVQYPFKSLDGKVSFGRQVTGKRTFDYNKDGVAQYGMYADWLHNLGQIAGPQISTEMNRGAEAYLQMWERTTGVPRTSCRKAKATVTRRGIGSLRLGASNISVLRSVGQPSSRPGAIYRWCVAKSKGSLSAAYDLRGRAVLVAGTASHYRSGKFRPGQRSRKLRGHAKRVRAGVYLGPKGKGGARRVYLVRRHRIKAVGIASRSLARRPKALAGALRGITFGRTSTATP